jgi:transmembrane sensor
MSDIPVHQPLPPELDATLASRPDAEALRATWAALPSRNHSLDEAREAAWERLTARLGDSTRTPYTDDVWTPLVLLDDADAGPLPTALSPTPSKASSSAGRSLSRTASRDIRRSWRGAARWAAVLAVSIAGGATWRAIPIVHVAPVGKTPSTFALSDGSTVKLAGGARLTVPRALGWPGLLGAPRRDVSLDGTAFFDVAHDGRPFVVATSDASVEVLGTRFEVRSPTSAAGTVVQVASGKVAVSAVSTNTRIVLGVGEQTVVTASPLSAMRVPAARVATWRTGGLAAVNEPLGSVLAELARRYAVRITLADSAAADVQVSLFYPQAPALATILTDLCTARGLVLVRTSEGFTLRAARE